MKKRPVIILILICMLLNSLPMPVFAALMDQETYQLTDERPLQNPFSDVKGTDWFYEAAMSALQKGLFKGTSDTSFSPNGTMTRAMYVTVMGRMAGIKPDDYSPGLQFGDVSSDSWYAPYVKWAHEKGITSGVGGNLFDPEGLVTREQMAALTVRFFDAYEIPYPENVVSDAPADLNLVSGYAQESVLKLWRCGLFKGDDQGNFNPTSNATRGEAAVFANRTGTVVDNWIAENTKPQEEKKDEKPQNNTGGGSGGSGGGEGGGSNTHYVTFLDGQQQVDRFSVTKGNPLGRTPANEKTSKDGYIFIGWFTDPELTTPFYAEDPVDSNLSVYAKYEQMVAEKLTLTSFAQMDQDPDLSFIIEKKAENAGAIEDNIILAAMDGTEPVLLQFTDNGDTYTVSAQGGFRPGSSYELTLGEGYIFKDKADSIRIASFSIKKEEVDNLPLNDEMIFIKDTDEMSYTIGDADPIPVLQAGLMNSQTEEAVIGTFEYDDAHLLETGDILCIYETVDPRQRDYVNMDYSDDAEAYIQVTGIINTTVTFSSLDESHADKVVFMPDTIPFSVAELPTESTGTVESTAVDNDARTAMGLGINPAVEIGDFVVFYGGTFAELTEDAQVYYGVVTDVTGTTISYKKTTKEEIQQSMDTFLEDTPDGDELLEGVDTLALEEEIEKQVRESGFAKEAAEYLALLSTQTDGFQTMSGLTDFSLTDEEGNALTMGEMQLMGIGTNIKLSDKVNVTATLGKSSKYFKDGISLAVRIDAEFSLEGEDGELKIDLSATFVEELSVDIKVGAYADVTWYLFVPKFHELTFSTAVDLKNYAGVSVDVKMYTVAPEEESLWDQLKGIKGGQYKEIFEEIEDLKSKIDMAKEGVDRIQGYYDDLEKLWERIPEDVTNKEEYEGMLDTLGELNVTQELAAMLNLTNEAELDAGVRNLMERYAEMLENESDWIEIVNKRIFKQDFHIKIFAIRLSANFVVKGNVNIALGVNMEYVVGKRYSFWYDIISKTGGNSQMDLLDEKFAFQFYVMGELGLKMGVQAEIAVGIISTKIGSIGATAEFGPYVKMWGYFIYEYTKLRPANTNTWTYDERMMGALYLEFGLYLEITFKATLFGKVKYQPTLLDKEWPLLTVGTRNNVYGFAYEIADDEVLLIEDHDSNSANGITMSLPESYRLMAYIDLCEGNMEQAIYEKPKFNYTLSNRNFILDENTGVITVNVPEDIQYMECDLTLTWKSDKLAFSLYDLTVTIPLVWTNLSTEELNQRFTATVRAGNQNDGYTTVWTQRVIKNAPFDLPTDAEIRELLKVASYDAAEKGNLRYSQIDGYGNQATEGLTILQDTSYYFEVTPRNYTLTIKDVEKSDGTKENRQFSAKFGEVFDFSALINTGTEDYGNNNYTIFLKILTKDSVNKEVLRDFNQPLGNGFALEILNGASYTATYADNSATAIFQFEGVDLSPIEIKMKKGDIPSSAFFDEALNGKNAIVKNISPAFAPITGATTYTVLCEVQEIPIVSRQITFNSNGGSAVTAQTYPVGSVISPPNNPIKNGYNFEGWFKNEALTEAFAFTTMPNEELTLYAKWSGMEYTVNFDPTEGNDLPVEEASKTVTFGDTYGKLPLPERTGFAFTGWYTERAAGERITADTPVTIMAPQTLYAHWSNKMSIEDSIISITANQSYDYNGEHHDLVFTTGESGIEPSSFIVEYKRQNKDTSWGSLAVNAGNYDVKITRNEDATYQRFEKTFTNVMTINKISRIINVDFDPTGSVYKANILVDAIPDSAYPGDGTIEYAASPTPTIPTSGWQDYRAIMNLKNGNYYLFVRVLEGENYWATSNVAESSGTFTIEGFDEENTMGYSNYFGIQTSNISDAGTDSVIKGRFYYVDGTSSDLTHFAYSGYNDFERGDYDEYAVNGLKRVPWMIRELEIDYTKAGSKPGWHCEYVKPRIFLILNFSVKRTIETENISVNQWFGAEENPDSHVVWKGSTDSLKRYITGVGNFNDLTESINLQRDTTGSYTFTYDGMVFDQYGYSYDMDTKTFSAQEYMAYDYFDAPTLSITSSEKAYEACLDYTINSITINQEALIAAMDDKGETETTLTVTLQFPERSTTSDTATWTKNITVRLAD